MLARFGGEEFIIAISFEGLSHLTKRISKLQKLIESKHIENRNSDVSKDITVSIGSASVLPNPHLRYTDIIKKSDEMLYQAKDEGRNRFIHREI